MSDLQQQIDALSSRVAKLEAERWTGPPRLGPQPETPEQITERTKRLVEAVESAKPRETDHKGRVMCTTNGKSVEQVRSEQVNETGQHDGYIVLCADERAKGFVRPYRDAYKHTSCGTVTTMGRALSETYARDPKFYGATFCCGCNRHL